MLALLSLLKALLLFYPVVEENQSRWDVQI